MSDRHNAIPMDVDTTYRAGAAGIAAFIAVTAGTITVTDADGTVLLNAFPITPSMDFVRIPMLPRTTQGMTVTLGGGASGTLFT